MIAECPVPGCTEPQTLFRYVQGIRNERVEMGFCREHGETHTAWFAPEGLVIGKKFSDTGGGWREGDCPSCGLRPTQKDKTGDNEFADPCLGVLPGVWAACCGHGECKGYITFDNGVRVELPRKEISASSQTSHFMLF